MGRFLNIMHDMTQGSFLDRARLGLLLAPCRVYVHAADATQFHGQRSGAPSL